MDRMDYVGKYRLSEAEDRAAEYTVYVRNCYSGGLHILLRVSAGEYYVPQDVSWKDGSLRFAVNNSRAGCAG